MQKINLAEKFTLIHEHWSPKIVAELNGQHLKLARLKGEFVWHRHPAEDELFLVLHGDLTIRFRNGEATLREGELIVVPAGVEHLPVAVNEVEVLLLEPASTRNTGDVVDDRTVQHPDWI